MKIQQIRTTPLYIPYAEPFSWARGTVDGARVLLIQIETGDGIIGYGECIASPAPRAIEQLVRAATTPWVGQDPFHISRLTADAYTALFRTFGTCSAPRFGAQVLSGLEMALWDVCGKSVNRPAYDLLGGPVRECVDYFGFAQGSTPEQIAAEAASLAAAGHRVIYVKVGRGDALDLSIVREVRSAIGPNTRLRVDANESWSVAHANRMIRELEAFEVEMVEQPTPADSFDALRAVSTRSSISISADQAVFSAHDVLRTVTARAADLIVLGPHETGGLIPFLKAAHVAEVAGLDVCIHGLYETGITTCASHQLAALLPNLDDGNQIMTQFLEWDLVRSPELTPVDGSLSLLTGPGLGFELDQPAVDRAADAFKEQEGVGR